LSWYSISASASAEPQSKHQCTGFTPRARWPRSTIFASGTQHVRLEGEVHGAVGLCQSPSTPRRWKSRLWPAICSAAYSRHFCRNAAASSLSPTLPCFFSTASSIGRPWQSQPGT
jgi:hypothetical protein